MHARWARVARQRFQLASGGELTHTYGFIYVGVHVACAVEGRLGAVGVWLWHACVVRRGK